MARPSEGKKENLVVRLTPEKKREVRLEAADTGKDMSAIMLEGFELYKKKHTKKKV